MLSVRRGDLRQGILITAATLFAAAGFALGAHIFDLDQQARSAWADFWWTAAAALVTWQCSLTARYVQTERWSAWHAYTLAGASWLFGMLVWSFYELALQRYTPFPSLADVGFLAYPVFMIIGFLLMPTKQELVHVRLWKAATLLIFVSMVCFITTVFLFSATGDVSGEAETWIALSYPVTYALAFFYAAFLSVQHFGSRIGWIFFLICASLAAHTVTNTPYAIALITGEYLAGSYIDTFWIIALMLMAGAAWARRHLPTRSLAGTPITLTWEVMIPLLCGVAGISVLALLVDDMNLAATPYLGFFAVLYLVGAGLQKYSLLKSEEERAAEARAANEELRENQVRFQDLAELTADWFWETDMDQRFTFLSASSFLKGVGLIAQEWLGKTRFELQSTFTDRSLAEEVQGYMDKGEAFFDLRRRFRHVEHGESWLSISGKPIHDRNGNIVGYRGIGRNVTAEEEAKRRIQEQRALLRLVIDNVPATVFLKDLEGRFILYNQKQKEFLQASRKEIEGYKTSDLLDDKELAREFEKQDREVIEARESRQFESLVVRQGNERLYQVTKFPVFDADGNFVAIGGINQDVTDKHDLERQLRQAQKLEAVGQLTGGIAHDFNNLLAIILSNAETLAEDAKDRPDLVELSRTIESAAERGAELTNHLLAFSRQQGLEAQAFDVNARLSAFGPLLARTLGETIEIETQLADGLAPAYADPSQFESAILNLAINARDAMPDGGKLIIATRDVSVRQEDEDGEPKLDPGDYVCVSVTDNGVGMTPDIVERAFDPFFTSKEVGEGTGLGLSMVYGFLKQSGGSANLYSEPGIGTTVNLYLPCADAAPESEKPEPSEDSASPQGSETILVVEDNKFVRRSVVRQLHSLGYETIEAEDGKSALEVLQSDRAIDLLFSDMVLPGGLHGYDVATEGRRLRPEMKIVFTTGFSGLSEFQIPEQFTETPVVRKPYRRSELATVLREVLD